ncbi:AraC family transcriptional regulator [Coprobacillus cateniformis]|nr:AraC family transcriptional regulator [Coprobacillus cateniformis]
MSTSLGFNTQSYLTNVFKKYVNCTPIEYRNHLDTHQH